MKANLAVFWLAVVSVCNACGSGTLAGSPSGSEALGSIKASGQTPAIHGFKHTLPFPRNDVRPGTILLRWDDDEVNIVCQPNDHYSSRGETAPSQPIEVSVQQEKQLAASLQVKGGQIAKAKLTTAESIEVNVALSFVPFSVKDQFGDIDTAIHSPECKKRVGVARNNNPKRKIRFLSFVIDVAEMTTTYKIAAKSTTEVDAETGDAVAKALGASAAATVNAEGKSTISVSVPKLVGVYNSDDYALKPMLAD